MNRVQKIERIRVDDLTSLQHLFGDLDRNLDWLEEDYGVRLGLRRDHLVLTGNPDAVDRIARRLRDFGRLAEVGKAPTLDDLRTAVELDFDGQDAKDVKETLEGRHTLIFDRKTVSPKGAGQQAYVRAIRESSLTFGIGPAGTGKTYLAVACAMDALLRKQVKRIVLARPAVEAGESLGFLPGDLYEKINPYLRPLYDALYDIIDMEKAQRLLQRGTIEVAPIAYMRGRTLNDSFVILDEAQNTTNDQMKMLLTRLGFHSKAVITGDITQIDLPRGKISGLIAAERVLGGLPGIEFVHLSDRDVVRHPLVRVIIEAYRLSEEEGRLS